MTTMEILGQSHDGNSLWVSIDGDEFDITAPELAVVRRSIQRGYAARYITHRLDESQVTALIQAMDAPQRFWPPVICREGDCGAEASVRIGGEPYCHGHAQGFTAREDEGTTMDIYEVTDILNAMGPLDEEKGL